MKLLELAKKNLEEYISVIDAISIIARTQETPIQMVGGFLFNQKFDEEIPTYSCNEYYVLYEDELNWNTFSDTYQILSEITNGDEYKEAFTFKDKKVSTLLARAYWKKADLLNFEIFKTLSIDFYFRVQGVIELIRNKKLPVDKFKNIEELTIDDVKELLGEDHRTYLKKDQENFIISAFVESLQRCFNYFEVNSNLDVVIEKKRLKTVFFENRIIIDGFNDELDDQVKNINIWDEDYLSQLEEESSLALDDQNDELEFLDFISSEEVFSKESNKQKNYPLLYKNDTFTVEEAACLVSGYEVINVESRSSYVSWRNENPIYVEAENWIYSLVRGGLFEEPEHNFYIIKSIELKKYLTKIGKIIEGFNDETNLSEADSKLINENNNLKSKIDELSKEVQRLKASSSDVGTPSVGHATSEHYRKHRDELLIEVEKLRSELLDKDGIIEKLKSSQFVKDNHPSLDPTNPKHAPELVMAINVWEEKYINKKHEYHQHTPAIELILKEKGVDNARLRQRIAAITNPKK